MTRAGCTDRNERRHPAITPYPIVDGLGTARAVIGPDGTLWPSMGQAAEAYGVSATAIRYRATKRIAGWRFAGER